MCSLIRILSLFAALALLAGCATVPAASSGTVPSSICEPTLAPEPVEPESSLPSTAPTTVPTMAPTFPTTIPTEAPTEPSLLGTLTLREKVGQLFLVDPDPLVTGAPVTELTEELQWVLSEYPVGGVILFYDNITDPDQLTAFNASLSAATRIPMFLAVDEEGGPVARVASHPGFAVPHYSSAAAVGAQGDPGAAREMGSSIGAYLRELGFNMDFAPVADINTNPQNPIIGVRAFSSDPETAAVLAHACAEGLSSQGIVPVFKHFPGHGDTAEDSHSEIAVSGKTLEELRSCEWLPYTDAFGCVMVGHIAVPAVLGDQTPATFSHEMVTEYLKSELGFDGLVITDSLSMGAVTNHFSPGEAALAALDAGCDLLLMPEDLPAAFEAVLEAVESGAFPAEELDRRVETILRFKQAHGIWSDSLPAL